MIFIGAVLDGTVAALGLGGDGAGFAPHPAISTTTDHPAQTADRRAAMLSEVTVDTSPETRLNLLAAVDAPGAELVLKQLERGFLGVTPWHV